MKTLVVSLYVLAVFCTGALVAGCGGGSSMDVQAPTGKANQSPEEKAFRAAGEGDLAAVKTAVGANAELLKARAFGGATLLHTAAADGQNAVVTYLLEQGANPKAVDENNATPIDSALGALHKDTAKIITDWIAKHAEAAPQQ